MIGSWLSGGWGQSSNFSNAFKEEYRDFEGKLRVFTSTEVDVVTDVELDVIDSQLSGSYWPSFSHFYVSFQGCFTFFLATHKKKFQ